MNIIFWLILHWTIFISYWCIGLAKKFIWVFPYGFTENPNELVGQPNIYSSTFRKKHLTLNLRFMLFLLDFLWNIAFTKCRWFQIKWWSHRQAITAWWRCRGIGIFISICNYWSCCLLLSLLRQAVRVVLLWIEPHCKSYV